jgi:hypothetical protein
MPKLQQEHPSRGGFSTPASPLPSLDQQTTTAAAVHARQVSTKLHSQLIVATHVQSVIIPINTLPLLAIRAPKDSLLILLVEAFVRRVLLDVSVISLHKRLHRPASAATLENTHLLQTPPPALNARQAQTTKILKV